MYQKKVIITYQNHIASIDYLTYVIY